MLRAKISKLIGLSLEAEPKPSMGTLPEDTDLSFFHNVW